jgi:hypothetical protein
MQTALAPGLVVDGVRSTSRLGNIARGAVAAVLLQAGKCVLLPMNDDQRYDLVIDEGSRFVRVQCKYGRLRNAVVTFQTCSNNLASGRRHYREAVEYFGVYCGELGTSYLVPVDHVPLRMGSLRVGAARNNQSQKIRWAKDYLIGETSLL